MFGIDLLIVDIFLSSIRLNDINCMLYVEYNVMYQNYQIIHTMFSVVT